MPAPNWIYAFASATGNSHTWEDIPCQDACKVANYDDYIIAVVCDGAGSCANSHFGAQQVADSCIYLFSETVKTHKWSNGNIPTEEQWRDAAKKCLFAAKHDLEKYSLSHDMELRTLSCTVIVAVAFSNFLLVTHIGDGRAGYCNAALQWQAMMKPLHGEHANQTVFITSDIWDQDVVDTYVESRIITGDVKAFCLLTDGCERAAFECNLHDEDNNTWYDPNRPYPLFFNPNVSILSQLHAQGHSQQEINNLWQKFLEAGNDRLKTEPDDKTMVLAVRTAQY